MVHRLLVTAAELASTTCYFGSFSSTLWWLPGPGTAIRVSSVFLLSQAFFSNDSLSIAFAYRALALQIHDFTWPFFRATLLRFKGISAISAGTTAWKSPPARESSSSSASLSCALWVTSMWERTTFTNNHLRTGFFLKTSGALPKLLLKKVVRMMPLVVPRESKMSKKWTEKTFNSF